MDKDKLKELNKKIPHQWRVQSYSKNVPKAQCVAYIDARDVMNLLDEVVGKENWQDDYKVIDGKLMAGIGVCVNDKWVWKWDTGTESNTEAEKGQISDAFKRAGVKWGIGRFLYDLDMVWVNTDKPQEINDVTKKPIGTPKILGVNNEIIYNLTKFVNSITKNK